MTFQSGELRGREFEVNYDTEKKEFEIITQWPYDDDLQLPSEPLIPAPGDEYILWNIRMPESYYPAAELEYKEAVDRFMADNRKDVSVWQAPTDFTVIDAGSRPAARATDPTGISRSIPRYGIPRDPHRVDLALGCPAWEHDTQDERRTLNRPHQPYREQHRLG